MCLSERDQLSPPESNGLYMISVVKTTVLRSWLNQKAGDMDTITDPYRTKLVVPSVSSTKLIPACDALLYVKANQWKSCDIKLFIKNSALIYV
jgi:hypothetical protein